MLRIFKNFLNFSASCTQTKKKKKKKIDLQEIPQTTKARSKIGANKLLIIFLRYPIVRNIFKKKEKKEKMSNLS